MCSPLSGGGWRGVAVLGRGTRNTTSPLEGTTQGPQGHRVGGKDICSVGCQGDNSLLPFFLEECKAHRSLGPEHLGEIVAKQRRCSARVVHPPVCRECGSRGTVAGPCFPTLGRGAVWARASSFCVLQPEGPCWLHRHTFLSSIWVAGIQLPPIKLGPARPPALAPLRTEGYGARTC